MGRAAKKLCLFSNPYANLINVFVEIYNKFKDLNDYRNIISREDIAKLIKIRQDLKEIGEKYSNLSKKTDTNIELQNSFIYTATLFNETITKRSSSDELSLNAFKNEYQKAIISICTDIELKANKPVNIWDSFTDFKMESSINQIGKYCFIDKPTQEIIINKRLICDHISKYLDIAKPLENLTTSEILSSIRSKRVNDKAGENLGQLLTILYNSFIEQYFTTTIEIKRGSDRLNESNSAGVNALYYICLIRRN